MSTSKMLTFHKRFVNNFVNVNIGLALIYAHNNCPSSIFKVFIIHTDTFIIYTI